MVVTRPSLPGFDHITRYYDSVRGSVLASILPGEYYVTRADELVTTVLGSCVSACIWDPDTGIGGMNHFVIPTTQPDQADAIGSGRDAARYGVFAMGLLIETIQAHGGRRERLQVKLVGGGRIAGLTTAIGDQNVGFALRRLQEEGLPVVGRDVGGVTGRKVLFHPPTGRVEVRSIVHESAGPTP